MNQIDLIVRDFYENRFKGLVHLWLTCKNFERNDPNVLKKHSDREAFCLALERLLETGRLRIFTLGILDKDTGLTLSGMLGGSFKDQVNWFRQNIPAELPSDHPDYDEMEDPNDLWWICRTTFCTNWLRVEDNGDITWISFD